AKIPDAPPSVIAYLRNSRAARAAPSLPRRRVHRVRANINDAAFVDAVVEAFDLIAPSRSKSA
ncbi:MAG: hypothetical protein WA851_22005, partial [Xanthobacteraceae bacterium]